MIAFVNANLIDGTGAAPRPWMKILVEGEKIHAIGKYVEVPLDATVYDLNGKSVIPGLIESHTHWGNGYRIGIASPQETDNYRRTRNALLANGITTCRSCGDYKDDILRVRDQLNSHQLRGPRMVACGPHLMSPDSHPAATVWGDRSNGTFENCGVYPKTPAEARYYVNEWADKGVDFIKVIFSNFHYMSGPTPAIDPDIVEAIIDEAHKLGHYCMVHVENLKNAMIAVERGADALEHLIMVGHTLNTPQEFEPLFRKMCENDVWLCPTMATFYRNDCTRMMKKLTGFSLADAIPVYRRAYEYGVPISCGTDAGRPPTPWGPSLHAEMEIYVKDFGMTALEAIRTCTYNNAKAMRLEGKIGQIKVAACADLVVLDKDPSVDIRNTRSIRMVMHDGKLVWGDGAKVTPEDMPDPEHGFKIWNYDDFHDIV